MEIIAKRQKLVNPKFLLKLLKIQERRKDFDQFCFRFIHQALAETQPGIHLRRRNRTIS
jgi:hypothetical protein